MKPWTCKGCGYVHDNEQSKFLCCFDCSLPKGEAPAEETRRSKREPKSRTVNIGGDRVLVVNNCECAAHMCFPPPLRRPTIGRLVRVLRPFIHPSSLTPTVPALYQTTWVEISRSMNPPSPRNQRSPRIHHHRRHRHRAARAGSANPLTPREKRWRVVAKGDQKSRRERRRRRLAGSASMRRSPSPRPPMTLCGNATWPRILTRSRIS